MPNIAGLAVLSPKLWDAYKIGFANDPAFDEKVLAAAQAEYEKARKEGARALDRQLRHRHRSLLILKWVSTPIVAAALILFLNPFGGSGVAWGKVMERVGRAPTTVIRGASYLRGEDKELKPFLREWTGYYSKEFGVYYELRTLGTVTLQWYVSPDRKQMTFINPQTGEVRRLSIDAPGSGGGKILDPKKFVGSYLSHPYVKIGKQLINGDLTEGIEYRADNDPDEADHPKFFPDQKIFRRLWVSIKTGLPARREDRFTWPWGEQVDISDMEWNIPLSSSLFQIPEIKKAPEKK